MYYSMPKKIIDYSKTIIYKLVCRDLTIADVYVGHTTNFIKRKATHKESCNNINSRRHHLRVYHTIRENGGWDNWSMIEVENYPCSEINQATKQERYWYETLNAKLNTQCPNRNISEWREEHSEQLKDKKSKQYICECGMHYTHCHRKRHERTKRHQDYINNQNTL